MGTVDKDKAKYDFSQEMLSEIEKANFGAGYNISVCADKNPSVVIDFADPKGASIKINNEFVTYFNAINKLGKEDKKLSTVIHYEFKNLNSDDNKGLEVSTKKINNFNRMKPYIISKDTIGLIADAKTRKIIIAYMNEIDSNEVLVVGKGWDVYIMPVPKDFKGAIDDLLFSVDDKVDNLQIEKTESKKLDDKEDLKVYETPSDMMHSYILVMTQSAYFRYVDDELGSNKVYKNIINNAKLKDLIKRIFWLEQDMEILEFVSEAVEYLNYKMMQSYKSDLHLDVFENIDKKNTDRYLEFHDMIFKGQFGQSTQKIFEFLDEVAKEGAKKGNYLSIALSDVTRFKNATGKNPLGHEIVFFDPQAGSAKGFFEAVDRAGMSDFIKMFGFDIRENIDISPNEKRFRVIEGVNTTLYADTIKETFLEDKYKAGSASLLAWNNPPYSLDDGIAKDTIKMYNGGMNLTGLYPTKMRNFLTNHLTSSSILVEVPREVTGYTDPKTPETFTFVLGMKRDEESEYNLGKVKNYKFIGEPKEFNNYLLNIVADDNFRIGAKVLKNLDYHKDRPFENKPPLEARLENNIENVKNLFKNVSFFQTLLQKNEIKDEFYRAVQPTELAKSEKIFIDNRFYSASNEYEYLTFNEVITNPSLLMHYIKHNPKIFNIIEQIANEMNITLPIDKNNVRVELFKFGEKYQGEKARVTTENLGMVKYAFYPDAFDVKDKKSIETLLELIVDIYRDKGRELTDEELAGLKKQIFNSAKLVTRVENLISVNSLTKEYNRGYTEVLCFVDDYGMVVGDKLPIPLYDLYLKMEEKGLLNIKDYIEVAELSLDNKMKIAKGLSKILKEVTIKDLTSYLGVDRDSFIEEIISSQNTPEDLVKKYKLDIEDYLNSYYKKGSSLKFDNILKNVLTKHLKTFYQDKPTQELNIKIKQLSDYIKGFYDKDKVVFLKAPLIEVLNQIKALYLQTYQETFGAKAIEMIFSDLREDIQLNMSELQRHNEVIDMSGYSLTHTLFFTFKNIENLLRAIENSSNEEFIQKCQKEIVSALENWEQKVAQLMEHQINEPKSFIELNDKDDIRDIYLLQKMRTGKTLKFLYIALLKMLKDGDDINVMLESKNIKDITQQMSKHMAFLMPMMKIFAGNDKHQYTTDRSFDYLPHKTAMIYPLNFVGKDSDKNGSTRLKRELGGALAGELKENFTKTMEMLSNSLDEAYPNDSFTIEELAQKYKDSRFVGILEGAMQMCG